MSRRINFRAATSKKRKLSVGPPGGGGTGKSREKTPKQSNSKGSSARVQKKSSSKRGRSPEEASPDSPASLSEKPPKRTRSRKKKETHDPAALLAEMNDLEKRLRSTVGGTECPDDAFKKMVDHLKTVCPGPKMCKIVVNRLAPEEMESEHGYCTKLRNVFTIDINRALNEYETEHILIHEWAHMLAWRPYHPLMGDHGSDWGVWYAMVWRKYHGVE